MMNLSSSHVSTVLCHVAPPDLVSIGGCVPCDPVIGGGAPSPGVSHPCAPVIKLTPDIVLIRLKNNLKNIIVKNILPGASQSSPSARLSLGKAPSAPPSARSWTKKKL